ncbi:hypothetical protein C2S52_018664 [Perilla frutescens var. hirtella]|nr:hypothetical protein C2S52_018664 [Perilla frutescens var. hirtella]
MLGRRSLNRRLAPVFVNIHRPRRFDVFELERKMEANHFNNPDNANANANAARNMRDFAHPVIGASTSCIVLGEATWNYELKNIHFSQLSSFYGMPAEDALNFIREFYSVVQTFPLQASSFTQYPGEAFHEAWDRFRGLQQQSPHHYLAPELLNQFFYDGLSQNFQYMVDNASGGDIGGRTAEEQLAELTRQVKMLRTSKRPPQQVMTVETCGICGEYGHGANLCQRSIEPESSEEAHFHALQEQHNNHLHLNKPEVAKLNLIRCRNNIRLNPINRQGQHCQIAGTVGELAKQAKPGKLPSQREQAQAITILRGGKVIDNKFFKELASKKRKFGEDEKIEVSEVASAILQHQLPPKLRDPGSFTLKIALGNGKEACGMLDLGAGINLIPYSIYKQLELGELKPTRMCLQLADRSVRYPRGIIEDILVKVGGLIIPVDFVVLDVGGVKETGKEHTLLLGRPFMATTNTLIDVKNGTLKISVLGEIVSFSVHENKAIPVSSFAENCSYIDAIDVLIEEVFLQEIGAPWRSETSPEELAMDEAYLKCGETSGMLKRWKNLARRRHESHGSHGLNRRGSEAYSRA